MRSKKSLWQKVVDLALTDVTTLVKGIDEGTIEQLERVLLEADFGPEATVELVEELERAAQRGKVSTAAELRRRLGEEILAILRRSREDGAVGELRTAPEPPSVCVLFGVNGSGKTTTAGKLARRFIRRGEKVLLAAADTFRAGARSQLREWADRVGAEFVGGAEGGDPAAVVFDALDAARSRGVDRVLVDTAGRLHTQRGLMEELGKIDRVVGRKVVEGVERLLVVDATSGQNVLVQAREFGGALPLTGIVLSKLDSSSRGGTVVAVARELAFPVRYVGTGEGPDDLELFDPERYLEDLLAEA